MIFDHAVFIKPDIPFQRAFSFENSAPVFRKKFHMDSYRSAKLYVCCLGIGYCFLNGQKVSEDLFSTPFSNYMKTIWYQEYDVSGLLKEGENVITIFCGNGFFNETLDTKSWGLEKAQWRDHPKVILCLKADERTVLVSDDSFRCLPESATFFNQIRRGEYFDARRYEEAVTSYDYDDSAWPNALKDFTPPTGIFRKCLCEPIRECEVLSPVNVIQTGPQKYVFDIGRNISGYIRLTAVGQRGDLLTIRYCEELTDDHQPAYNQMDTYPSYYQTEGFQTDKFICSGKRHTWSPMFTYHGFRYMEIDGIRDIETTSVLGVFVHQDIRRRTSFHCSDEFLNQLFTAGINSTYSNMFYALTDCPTREKMAWTNDFMASAEQAMIHFHCENLFHKYQQDIYDAMLGDGSLPGIIPCAGWWYRWDLGPIGDGILFELPYRIYLHTGDDSMLKESLPYFERHFHYMDSKKGADGLTHHGLGDWSPPAPAFYEPADQNQLSLINAVLEYYFYWIASLADAATYEEKAKASRRFAMNTFLNASGQCTVNKQTAVSMMIYYGVYDDIAPLKAQLARLVEEKDFHLSCGMVGMRRLLLALNRCGLSEYAYKILTADGHPGYREWFKNGATTLYERWEPDMIHSSHNHHMFSDFMSWMVKTLAGISCRLQNAPSYDLAPVFLPEIDFADCDYDTASGKISVHWTRQPEGIRLTVDKDSKVLLYYQGRLLESEHNTFFIPTNH